MNYTVEALKAKLGEIETEKWLAFVMEKLKELLVVLVYLVNKLIEKVGEIEKEEWMNYIMEKVNQSMVALQEFGRAVIIKINEVFPPETRVDQLKELATTPSTIAFLVVIVLISRCCCSGGSSGKTMKAPGRDYRMSRKPFESNPRSYFRNLRGKTD